MKNFMVFDIGGTAVKWSIINEEGILEISGKMSIAKLPEEFFENLANLSNEMKVKYNVEGIAISSPGAVDSETGIVGGISAIPYIHGPNFKEILKKSTGLNVEIENDANCAALGECWLGSGKDNNDLAFVVCGSGIGGALIKENKIHKGIHKHGGEFGYCIVDYDINSKEKFKTWSTVGSTTALAKRVAIRKNLGESELDGVKVFELAECGDEIAIEEVNRYYYYMAIGIYNIQYNYDPELIILGGAISERNDYINQIEKRIDLIMKENPDGKIKPVIRKCLMGNDTNKLGALYNYLQRNN